MGDNGIPSLPIPFLRPPFAPGANNTAAADNPFLKVPFPSSGQGNAPDLTSLLGGNGGDLMSMVNNFIGGTGGSNPDAIQGVMNTITGMQGVMSTLMQTILPMLAQTLGIEIPGLNMGGGTPSFSQPGNFSQDSFDPQTTSVRNPFATSDLNLNNLDPANIAGDTAFDKACNFSLKWEGGTSHDAGCKASNMGIEQRDLNAHNRSHGDNWTLDNLTQGQVKDIMYENYWVPSGADKIAQTNPKLAIAVFDTAFNNGVGAAHELLNKSGGDLTQFCQLRRQLYYHIAETRPEKASNLRGWMRRENDLERTLAS